MSSELLWNSKSITKKQLPTVFDALNCCNHKVLLNLVESLFFNCSGNLANKSPKARRAVKKKLKETLTSFLNYDICRSIGKKYVVFAVEEFSVHKNVSAMFLQRCLKAQPVLINDLANANFDDALISFKDISQQCALACRFWLGGVHSCYERYMVLASAFVQILAIEEDMSIFNSMFSNEGVPLVVIHSSPPKKPIPASVSEFLNMQASSMGLQVEEELEESYTECLLGRVEKLNDDAYVNLNKHLKSFSSQFCT